MIIIVILYLFSIVLFIFHCAQWLINIVHTVDKIVEKDKTLTKRKIIYALLGVIPYILLYEGYKNAK